MFKRKGGGVKGLLNNVKKNCTFLSWRLPLDPSFSNANPNLPTQRSERLMIFQTGRKDKEQKLPGGCVHNVSNKACLLQLSVPEGAEFQNSWAALLLLCQHKYQVTIPVLNCHPIRQQQKNQGIIEVWGRLYDPFFAHPTLVGRTNPPVIFPFHLSCRPG